jgi:hypothetical protein
MKFLIIIIIITIIIIIIIVVVITIEVIRIICKSVIKKVDNIYLLKIPILNCPEIYTFVLSE